MWINDIECPHCKKVHKRNIYIRSKKEWLNCVICPACGEKF